MCQSFHRTRLLSLSLLFAVSFATGQTNAATAPQEASGSPVTLRAQARLVVLDVVVTDKHGDAVHDLAQGDFALRESGKVQVVKAFNEHKTPVDAQATKLSEMPHLPAGTFTNLVQATANDAVDVLLIDTLNTPLVNQVYVRDQMLKYLKTAHPGARVAVFGLASHLYILQGFTSDPELLRAAIDKTRSKGSPLLDDSAGLGKSDVPISDQIAANGGGSLSAGHLSSLKAFEVDDAVFKVQLRAETTLNALSVLGRYLAALPGRKNVIWFSGSFPINILPGSADEQTSGIISNSGFTGSASFQKQFLETTNLLTRGRVAVYPVDARGLTGNSFNSAAQGFGSPGSKPFTPQIQDLASTTYGEHNTMEQMARDTGGHAYFNTNGLTDVIAKVVENGSNFYTFAYTPADTSAIGEFRRIDVKLSDEAMKKGYTLAYRRGYYAEKPDARDSALAAGSSGPGPMQVDERLLRGSLAHGMPDATQVIFKVQVAPRSASLDEKPAKDNLISFPGFADAKPPFQTYAVDYVAPARQTVFITGRDGLHHAALQFITMAYAPDGKPVSFTSAKVQADLNEERLAAFQHSVVTMHQEISVPAKGDYTIRTGVYDLAGDRLGSIETPVSVVKKLPPSGPVKH